MYKPSIVSNLRLIKVFSSLKTDQINEFQKNNNPFKEHNYDRD